MISLWLIDRSSLAFGASEIGLGLIFYSVNISFFISRWQPVRVNACY